MTDDDETVDLGEIVDDFRATLRELDEARAKLDQLRPHIGHLLDVLVPTSCVQCAEIRRVLEGLR